MKKDTETRIETEYEPLYWNPNDFTISFDELVARIKNKYGDEFDPSEKRAFNDWIRLLNDAWNEFYKEKADGE